MGWIDMPLDYVRLLIATAAIGISVDDTIHSMTRFRHEFLRSGSYERALEASTVDVGRALVITSVVLVADFLLMPALVLTWKPWGPGR
jgi:predicted RND superfamily exporter protein